MKTIAIVIRKGGTAKTTTAVNLASGLVKEGKRVLLVDLDPQANATTALGIYEVEDNIAGVFNHDTTIEDATMTSAGIDVLIGSTDLADVESAMKPANPLEFYKLKNVLAQVESKYDFTIIDTPPSDSMLVYNALVAADAFIMPAQTHTLSIKGIQQAMKVIDNAKILNNEIEFLGILPTMYQANTNMGDAMLSRMKQMYAEKVLDYPVPLTIKATESQLVGVPLLDHQPENTASEAYRNLAKYVIKYYGGKA